MPITTHENTDSIKMGINEISGTISGHILKLFSDIVHTITERAGQQEMLHEILKILEQVTGVMRCTVMLLSPEGTELIVEEVRDAGTDVNKNARYRWGEGITGRVLATGKTAIVPNIIHEPAFRDLIHHRIDAGVSDASFICVPIILSGDVIGTMSADMRISSNEQEMANLIQTARILEIVAALIANDVQNRRNLLSEQRNREAVTSELRDVFVQGIRFSSMIGTSKEMKNVYHKIAQVSNVDTTVLIRGESGTGKELVASAIHFSGSRAQGPFIKVHCGALNENLLESELFGHEKGAFTGAVQSRIGRIEEASGGTLFLDEIGDISPTVQIKLLRVLQEREFERVGSNKTIPANVRIVCATNRDLEKATAQGLFRQDLYYRINVFTIFLPPLRERREDIPSLANFFVAKYSDRMKKIIRRISTPAINALMMYHWPGNVRELENAIEHAVIVSKDGVIHSYDLPPTLQCPDTSEIENAGMLTVRVNALERDMIIDALKSTHGNIEAAARFLGVTSRVARYKIKKLGIDHHIYAPPRR